MDKFGLPERTINVIIEYFKNIPQIETVKIYGSRARGNFKPHSDIDFILYGENLTTKLTNRIASELDELQTPYKFDVILDRDITDEEFCNIVSTTAKIFYKNNP